MDYFPSQDFFDLRKKIAFGNFNIFENNINSGKLAKVLR